MKQKQAEASAVLIAVMVVMSYCLAMMEPGRVTAKGGTSSYHQKITARPSQSLETKDSSSVIDNHHSIPRERYGSWPGDDNSGGTGSTSNNDDRHGLYP
ncbi:hypothetical protein CRG98_014458 [Punica granatum]|nr:hypothetical protein CRG98_014458 [Punica granatum]